MTWASALDLFLTDLLKRGRKPSTVRQYRYDFTLFVSWVQKQLESPPKDVFHSFNVNTLECYLKSLRKERRASISNVKRVRGILIIFLQFHGTADSLKSNISPPKLTSKHFASDEEIKKLCNYSASSDKKACQIHVFNSKT